MRRLATAAAVGLVAFAASPVGAGSSAAAPPRARPVALARAQAPDALDAMDIARLERLEVAAAAAARASRRDTAADRVWRALASCESGGNVRARSAGGRYHGAFQFSVATWRSLGYSGMPTDHSYDVQLAAAKQLQARSGWRQWPACSRRLGLR